MEKTLVKNSSLLRFLLASLVGALVITCCAWIRIPFYPVPFTMQTFAIVLLGLTQTPKQALGSVITYLLLATMGLPVLSAKINPYWMMGPNAGYLFSFPLAAYIIAKMKEKGHQIWGIVISQIVIYCLGISWLAAFFGFKTAFMKGFVFFLPSTILKDIGAYLVATSAKKIRGIKQWLT